MPTITRIRPTAKVAFPHQSIRAALRTPISRRLWYDHAVAIRPTGTETRKTRRQLIGARMPPSTRPRNEPTTIAMLFTPSASPRSFCGNASVRMALELANTSAPPTPCPTRITISQIAPAAPCIQVTESRIENTVNTAKPRLNIRTRP